MEKTLDELIEFLLCEIAVGGAQGITPSEFREFVPSFYEDTSGNTDATPGSQNVDENFLQSVWKWLGRHPDVSVGYNRQYNNISLAEVEAKSNGSNSHGSNNPAYVGLRMCVSEDRIYRAICGHAPDPARVFPSEFTLLSHIAAGRSHGLLQGDLVRASGQDKRSVPRRTDALADKGYIVKKQVYVRGTRTSRLTLRRYFASQHHNVTPFQEEDYNLETIQDAINIIIRILEADTLLTIDDLASNSGMTGTSLARVLSKIVRQLERVGCVKRVKTAFEPSAESGDLKNCIQFLHRPTQHELDSFDSTNLRLSSPIARLAASFDAQLSTDRDIGPSEELGSPSINDESQAVTVLPQWNPDRIVSHVLLDAANLAGADGLTTTAARNSITGLCFRRPLESLLSRLSQESLLPQPIHLRHLILIRTVATNDGLIGFVYYSLSGFRRAVRQGRIDAAKVRGSDAVLEVEEQPAMFPHVPKGGRSIAKMDASGFPASSPPQAQFRRGAATFAELVKIAAPTTPGSRRSGPELLEDGTGNKVLGGGNESPKILRRPKPATRFIYDDEPPEVARGRPRKFLHGTEKFWQIQFQKARLDATDGNAKSSGKAGVMKDPAGLALFQSRPPDFDETLVKAADAGLPLPISPEEITVQWVHDTQTVLARVAPGAYITPTGMHLGRAKYVSRMMVVRSNKLSSLDLEDIIGPSKVRFISSSQAHSFRFLQNYGLSLATSPDRLRISNFKRRRKQAQRGSHESKRMNGPKLGVFLLGTDEVTRATAVIDPVPQLSPAEFREYMDSTESDNDSTKPSTRENSENGRTLLTSTHSNPTSPAIPHPLELEMPPHGERRTSRAVRQRKPTKKAAELLKNKGAQKLASSRSASLASQLSLEEALVEESSDRTASVPFADLSEPVVPVLDELAAKHSSNGLNNRESFEQEEGLGHAVDKSTEFALSTPGALRFPGIEDDSVDETDKSGRRDKPLTTSNLVPTVKSQKRPLPESDDSDAKSPSQSATKRVKKISEPRERQAVCRKIVVNLVALCSGAVPNNASTVRRVMVNGWRDARGDEDRPLLKSIKFVIKSLCETGKLKQIMFSFRGKRGVMEKRSILTLPSVDATGPHVQELKQRLINADETEYIPPEWENEARPRPGPILKNRSNFLEPLEPVRLEEHESEPVRGTSNYLGPESALTGTFLTLKCPRLGELAQVRRFNGTLMESDEDGHESSGPETAETPTIAARSRFNKPRRRAPRRTSGVRFDPATHKIIWGHQPEVSSPSESIQSTFEEEDEIVKFTPARVTRQSTGSRVRKKRIASTEDTDFSPPPKRTRRGERVSGPQPVSSPSIITSSDDEERPATPPTVKRFRKQNLRTVAEETVYQIAVTVVCIRTLAGGLERTVDWQIVMALFPGEEETVFRERWRTIQNKYRQDVANLTENFQWKYLEALSDGRVPSIDFDDPGSADWKAIVDWALANVDMTTNKEMEDLPPTRNAFLSRNHTTFIEFEGIRSILGYNVATTHPLKEEAVSGIVFGAAVDDPSRLLKPLHETYLPEQELESTAFARARSYVLAAILTPESAFHPKKTRAKLMSLASTSRQCEALTSAALEALQRDRVIIQQRNIPRSNGKLTAIEVSGMRTWDISAKFYETFTFRRMVQREMLLAAASYKINTLDEIAAQGEKFIVAKDAMFEDGEMIAVLNLLAMGMLKLRPGGDVPNSRYGIDHVNVGYQTKQIEKRHFAFSVEFELTSEYAIGDVAAKERTTAVPRGAADEPNGKFPAWLDINGTLQEELWEMFLAAILGLVSIRPGIDATELSRNVQSMLTVWEVGMILGWAEEADFVRRSGRGWETRDWWWLCLGTDWDWSS